MDRIDEPFPSAGERGTQGAREHSQGRERPARCARSQRERESREREQRRDDLQLEHRVAGHELDHPAVPLRREAGQPQDEDHGAEPDAGESQRRRALRSSRMNRVVSGLRHPA